MTKCFVNSLILVGKHFNGYLSYVASFGHLCWIFITMENLFLAFIGCSSSIVCVWFFCYIGDSNPMHSHSCTHVPYNPSYSLGTSIVSVMDQNGCSYHLPLFRDCSNSLS